MFPLVQTLFATASAAQHESVTWLEFESINLNIPDPCPQTYIDKFDTLEECKAECMEYENCVGVAYANDDAPTDKYKNDCHVKHDCIPGFDLTVDESNTHRNNSFNLYLISTTTTTTTTVPTTTTTVPTTTTTVPTTATQVATTFEPVTTSADQHESVTWLEFELINLNIPDPCPQTFIDKFDTLEECKAECMEYENCVGVAYANDDAPTDKYKNDCHVKHDCIPGFDLTVDESNTHRNNSHNLYLISTTTTTTTTVPTTATQVATTFESVTTVDDGEDETSKAKRSCCVVAQEQLEALRARKDELQALFDEMLDQSE